MKNYKQITYSERILLQHLLERNEYISLSEIVNHLGKSKSTWLRGIKKSTQIMWCTHFMKYRFSKKKYNADYADLKSKQKPTMETLTKIS
jgi:IS30 family transposase